MYMDRRSLLGVIGGSVPASWIAINRQSTTDTDSMSVTNSSLSVATSSVAADEFILTAGVSQRFENSHPAQVRVELVNGGETTRSVRSGPAPPLDPQLGYQRDGTGRVFLLPPDGTGYEVPSESQAPSEIEIGPQDRLIPQGPTDGCWRARSASVTVYSMARGTTLDPGESIHRRYALLAHPDNDPCLPAGLYEFRDTITIDDQEANVSFALNVAADSPR